MHRRGKSITFSVPKEGNTVSPEEALGGNNGSRSKIGILIKSDE